MIISCAIPILVVAMYGVLAPPISRSARPLVAIWMLSAGALALAVCEVAALAVVVALGAGQLAPFARLGHWSARAIGMESPFQTWSIWIAAILLAALAVRTVRATWMQGRRLQSAWSASRAQPSGLVVLADDAPFAYAVPGWPGRVVVSRGLLRSLDRSGRQAMLAHEQAHLAERHDLHQFAATVAAALNPFLFASPAALNLACERRADEVAARVVGDRRVVARAIATAVHPQPGTVAWSATGADVPLRVEALLSPPRDNRLASTLLLVAVVLAVAGSTACVLWLGHDLRSVVIAARH